MTFIVIDVLQFPHKSYLQNGYFFSVYVVAKKKLLVIRIFPNKQKKLFKKSTSFSLYCKEIYPDFKKKRNRYDIAVTEILLKLVF
jgi:hypothetical protein